MQGGEFFISTGQTRYKLKKAGMASWKIALMQI